LLFPTENKEPLINFQLFKGKPGAVWAYKQFLDIDLQGRLNTNWNTFLTYIDMRHKIIHGSREPIDTLIKKSDAEKAIALTNELKIWIDETLEPEIFKWL
ncbi:MAG: hypothetical protein L6244_07890, partial [Candidatus Methanoperedenaceae archaeon]|nr:hypothetical protein [Candidatus Methanoperedenaceae archaeon]